MHVLPRCGWVIKYTKSLGINRPTAVINGVRVFSEKAVHEWIVLHGPKAVAFSEELDVIVELALHGIRGSDDVMPELVHLLV